MVTPELDTLCRFLQAWGIPARLVTVTERETVGTATVTFSEWYWDWYYIQLEGRNIDTVELEKETKHGEGGPSVYYQIRYCVSDERQTAGKQVDAKTKIETEKTGFLKREVIGLHWVGGAVADLLNADTELKTMLLVLGETFIRIEPHRPHKCVRIFPPQVEEHEFLKVSKHEFPKVVSKHYFTLPSKELFEAYDTIAGHVRRAMTL